MQVALLCVQKNPSDRPSMLEVSSMLRDETIAMNSPKSPAFSVRGDEGGVQQIWSVDDATIIKMVAL